MADEAERNEEQQEEEQESEVPSSNEQVENEGTGNGDSDEEVSGSEDENSGEDEVEQEAGDEEVPEVQSSSEETQDQKENASHVGEGEEGDEFEESVVHVNRCCKVVQGGKQFSFSALVVAGNRNGKISYGFGKANQVPQAIQKAIDDSRKRTIDVPIVHGTIPHRVELEYCSTKLLLRPASPGTGVIAALPVRTTVNLAGITDLLTKVYGSTNPINCVKAVYEGLKSLRTKEEIEELRGVKIK